MTSGTWARVIVFADRFGREHRIVLMGSGREAMCRSAYGSYWPAMKILIGDLLEICGPVTK